MTLRTISVILWIPFLAYWLIAALTAKRTAARRTAMPPGLLIVVVFVVLRVFGATSLAVNNVPLQTVGLTLQVAGLGLAVWARIYLGRNWGMPMTQKAEPELVTTGPYRFVRHPIYSGLLLALLGTSLSTNVYLLIALVVMGAYFIYSATVEERLMTATFPSVYPGYREHTKMLIPFVI